MKINLAKFCTVPLKAMLVLVNSADGEKWGVGGWICLWGDSDPDICGEPNVSTKRKMTHL